MKKVTKKTSKKSYSGGEVKRYLGSLSEDFRHKVSAIGEQFGGLNKKLDEYGKMLSGHGRILNIHTMMLSSQAETLKAHTEMIGKLMLDMNIVKGDVQEIKTDLKQKVDRQEFARLERRVISLESVVHGGKSHR